MVDSTKVEAVIGWSRPTTVIEIRGFLGLTRYYQQINLRVLIIGASFDEINKEGYAHFIWNDECEASFEELKKRLVSAPVSYASI